MTRQSSSNDKDKERLGFSRRLADMLARTGRSLSPTRLAVEFNVYFRGPKIHMHSCRKWLQGESIPTQEKLVVLARMLGVSPDWLRYGEPTRVASEPHLNAYVTNAQDLALLASIQQLGEHYKQVVQGLIRVMLGQRGDNRGHAPQSSS